MTNQRFTDEELQRIIAHHPETGCLDIGGIARDLRDARAENLKFAKAASDAIKDAENAEQSRNRTIAKLEDARARIAELERERITTESALSVERETSECLRKQLKEARDA